VIVTGTHDPGCAKAQHHALDCTCSLRGNYTKPNGVDKPAPAAPVLEAVEHPAHYGGGDNPYEVIKVLRAWGLEGHALLWNAVKYIARAGKKDPTKYVEDLKKARFYLDRAISDLEGTKP
jgi:hypothetical protein